MANSTQTTLLKHNLDYAVFEPAEFKKHRKQLKLGVRTAANVFGVSKETLCRWEDGRSEIPLLAAVSIVYLLRYTEETRRAQRCLWFNGDKNDG